MRTLDELKKRATTSELLLIESVEAAVQDSAVQVVERKAIAFLDTNPLPDVRNNREIAEGLKAWSIAFSRHLREAKKD